MSYCNYHRHSMISNISTADSIATNEDYCKRAVELGHTIISSCEHGTQGNYRQCYELAKKYGLKWRYVVEAYFVLDCNSEDLSGSKDKTNAHIILAAKTEKGIGDLNEALSEAWQNGFYYKPRLDMSILSNLDSKDVFCTTACIGGLWSYDYDKETRTYSFRKSQSIVRQLKNIFKDSFMLQVQYHNTEKQKIVNAEVLRLSKKYNIDIIAGMDSHYIYPQDAVLRDEFLLGKNIHYEDEEGWYMDYPSDDQAYRRFIQQGVLSAKQIQDAMNNTHIFETFEDVQFDMSKKLPNIYKNKTQEERNEMYRQLIRDKWLEYRKNIDRSLWKKYEQQIAYEVDTITSTNMSDYFLLDYEMVKRFKEIGGELTLTGRGSAPSYFTNTLLGFSSIDRISMPVTMYPDRFISKDRLLSGSLPDIDLNNSDQALFAQAQKQIVGQGHSYQMIALGTLKRSAAWKLYCRANDIEYNLANDVSKCLKSYEEAYKFADDEEKQLLDINDFVPEQYQQVLKNSETYMGTISDIKPHPCGFVLFNGNIRRQFGLIKVKDAICAFVDGATADRFGYLKNDLLKVVVVKMNAEIYKQIGIEQPSVPQLMKLVDNDKETWDLYKNGYTLGLNQAEQDKSTIKVMTYKPRNVSQLTAFCAGIRPGFASMASTLLNRKRFSYGIRALDTMLQTKEMPDSFILYQEQVMMILQWGGFKPSESYAAIKAIAKKHPEKVLPLKERFLNGFSSRLINEEGEEEWSAINTANKVWKIIEDNTSYSFNASHAACVALDSLYTAYAKAHYPYETYKVMLSNYSESGKKNKIDRAKRQMKSAFGIEVSPYRFGQDNTDFTIDKKHHCITDCLISIKGVGMKDAIAIRDLGKNKYYSFIDLLYDMFKTKKALNESVIKTLIWCNYFAQFGKSGKLYELFKLATTGPNKINGTLSEKSLSKRINALTDVERQMKDSNIPWDNIIKFEQDKFGSPISTFSEANGYFCIVDVDTKYSPKISCYSICTGKIGTFKMKKSEFIADDFKKGNIIKVTEWKSKPAYQFVDNKPVPKPNGEKDIWLQKYTIKDLTWKDQK